MAIDLNATANALTWAPYVTVANPTRMTNTLDTGAANYVVYDTEGTTGIDWNVGPITYNPTPTYNWYYTAEPAQPRPAKPQLERVDENEHRNRNYRNPFVWDIREPYPKTVLKQPPKLKDLYEEIANEQK